MSDNTIRVRFRSFDSWLRVNLSLWEDVRNEFPNAKDDQIERLLLRVYRNQLISEREKLLRFVANSCLPGELSEQTRKSKGKEVNYHGS
jgi:hypothetical protein